MTKGPDVNESYLKFSVNRKGDIRFGLGAIKAKGYIAHVEIPEEVETAFTQLKREYPGMVREANPLYASADPQRF